MSLMFSPPVPRKSTPLMEKRVGFVVMTIFVCVLSSKIVFKEGKSYFFSGSYGYNTVERSLEAGIMTRSTVALSVCTNCSKNSNDSATFLYTL